MIVLSVTHYNGAPAERLEASFDELGGSIGRAPDNQLVLPDPERSVSRVHAQIVFRNGAYALVDRGSNPVSVNGRQLGHGREQVINGGDSLQIGGYTLQVRAGQAPRASSPFDDLFAPPTVSPAPPARPAAPGAWAPPPAPMPRPPSVPSPAWPAPAASAGPSMIPVDWDPLAPEVPDTTPHVRAQPALDLPVGGDPLAALGGSRSADHSLDDLFGLGAAAPVDPLQALGRALPPAADRPSPPAQGLNDLGDLGDLLGAPPVAPASRALEGGELQQPWRNPVAEPVPPASPPVPEGLTVIVPGGQPPAGAVFSWANSARDGKVVTLPPMPAAEPRAPVPLPPPMPAQPAAIGDDALLAALFHGLGCAPPPQLRLDAELLRRIGGLLREATQGSVELLQARAEVKRSVRAEMTAIVPRGNNPLKFSPSADTALLHLLGPRLPGFLDAETAMREAFDDLRAHELAVMAGMRAALDEVLKRFDPASLDARIEKRGGLGGLLAGSRKSRLWELFEQQYATIRDEAADDFQEFFGRAFLQAYEAQLQRLDRARRDGSADARA